MSQLLKSPSAQSLNRQQSGFTIIELMIATTVFSVILVMVTVMMISIGNLLYKGINQSRVQDAVRSITEEISHTAQLTNATPLATPVASQISFFTADGSILKMSAYCIDTTRYSYIIGAQITSQINHVLWRDTIPTAASCVPVNLTLATPSVGGTELMPPNSRLRNFSISAISPYTITVGIAYGDNDLLCSPSIVGTCTTENPMSPLTRYANGDLHCKGKKGDQFCSISSLTTTAVKRIN